MIHTQNEKSIMLLIGSVSNTAITATFDTVDFKYMQVDVYAPSISDTTVILTALKLEEAEVTTETSMATWTGSSVTNFAHTVISSPVVQQRFNVNLLGRKRYMMLELNGAGTTQEMFAQVRLSRPEVFASNSTDVNITNIANI